jgi:hypothetical protein
MTTHRFLSHRAIRCAWAQAVLFATGALLLAGLDPAAAQFPPPPGQTAAAPSGVFPPPPGQTAAAPSGVFPPPPGQQQQRQQQQSPNPFPAPGQASAPPAGFGSPSSGFGAMQQGGFGVQPGGFSQPPGGMGAPGAPSEAQKVCLTFPTIREDVEKGAAGIRAASERKATREEVCPLFKAFTAKEAKLVKFLETNQKLCGVPPNVITQVRQNHAKTVQIRNNVCSAAPAAAGPTLSDALGGPIIADDTSVKTGRGTFDTLTGNALQR